MTDKEANQQDVPEIAFGERKPVAWWNKDESSLSFTQLRGDWQPLYDKPQREWVGLTERERAECWYGENCHELKSPHDDYAKAIEAISKEKNHV